MSRRLLITSGVVALAASGLGYVAYEQYPRDTPPPVAPPFIDRGETLSSQQQFDKLAETDPVKMLAECLTRYQREVKGAQFTLRKQERVQGKPKPTAEPPVEVIDVCVRGDVPDPETNKTAIEVRMKWTSGARKPASDFTGLARPIEATLFSERPAPEGYGGKVVTRPGVVKEISDPMDPAGSMAEGQSRYCIRDAGLYRSMLRTHAAWAARQAAGELKVDYIGKRTPEFIGRECHVIKRTCPRIELDAFEIGGKANTDPKAIANEGFTEVTIFVDAERWLQVGTELYRTEPNGKRVLVGAYAFRDVQLNPDFGPETFTPAGMKK